MRLLYYSPTLALSRRCREERVVIATYDVQLTYKLAKPVNGPSCQLQDLMHRTDAAETANSSLASLLLSRRY